MSDFEQRVRDLTEALRNLLAVVGPHNLDGNQLCCDPSDYRHAIEAARNALNDRSL